jgi:hypothetical protein
MATQRTKTPFAAAAALLVGSAAAACLVPGCRSSEAPPPDAGPSTRPVHASVFQTKTNKSGSQLWGENCTRCHNVRPPQYYSDAQWDVIAHHMRLRANLTGDEQRKITEFLQASN